MSEESELQIKIFLSASSYAVAGASLDREKYGNKILRCYLQHGYDVIPVHPSEETIEGLPCCASVGALPDKVESLSVVTPPRVTEKIVLEAVAKGIKNVWMQPGAESHKAVEYWRMASMSSLTAVVCWLSLVSITDKVRFFCVNMPSN